LCTSKKTNGGNVYVTRKLNSVAQTCVCFVTVPAEITQHLKVTWIYFPGLIIYVVCDYDNVK